MSDNRITLRATSGPTITITGELTYESHWRYYVRLSPDASANSFLKTQWERVHDLPTVPGTVIRATIHGVPDVRAFRFEAEFAEGNEWWCSVRAIEGWNWHHDEDIDPSTVVVEFTPRDEEGNACPCA